MKVLMLHNRYRQLGGEDLSAQAEADLLRMNRVEVQKVDFDNEVAAEAAVGGKLRVGLAAAWSKESYARVRLLCQEIRPQVAHVQNFWMSLSPSVHAACQAAGVPTVQTLSNFRLLCTNALFLRNGRVCEDCLGKAPWRGFVRRCYRGSFLASAAVFRMIVTNRRRGTWLRDVDAFIALSQHSRSKFITGALPAERIFVRPNYIEDCGNSTRPPSTSDLVLYAGRLAGEKGLRNLLSAWGQGDLSSIGRLLIVGEGPDREALEKQAVALSLPPTWVMFAGRKSPDEVLGLIAAARAVVLPSLCFENFPRTVAEAFSLGRPVIVSDFGALKEIVEHRHTGLKFSAADRTALAEALKVVLTDDGLADQMGKQARMEYLAKYTPERNFETLMGIYRFAVERRGNPVPEMLRCFEPATATVSEQQTCR